MAAIFQAQVLTYLRLCNLKVGLVINFGLPRLIDGVNRVINNKYKP
ncbi:MAG: GxxExxY protein [Opitutales bacterium]